MGKGFARPVKVIRAKYFSDSARAPVRPDPSREERAEEAKLIQAARDGDPAAMRRLLVLVSRPAYRFGMTFCRQPEDAEEIAQDVLASFARSLARFRGDGSLSTWAYTVARNACIRRRKRSGPSMEPLTDVEHGLRGATLSGNRDGDPQAAVERSELRTAVAAAIRSLPPSLRETVILRDVEGLSARDAARVLRIGERALKSRLHRARAALRARLEPMVRGEDAPASRRPGCPDIARSWSLYLEGEVSAASCARLEAHVRTCRSCALVCRSVRRVLRACRLLRSRRLRPQPKPVPDGGASAAAKRRATTS